MGGVSQVFPCGAVLLLDERDAYLLEAFNWFVVPMRNTYYVRRNVARGVVAYMHRDIMEPPDGWVVDHIDGDGLNNRRANLRIATNGQNQANQRLRLNNTSGFKGVSWVPRRQRWHAYINKEGRRSHLGYFTDLEDARAAYAAASVALHGAFAGTPDRS